MNIQEKRQELSLKKRIEAELKSYDGTMGIYIDDLKGNVIAINENEKYETASTIKVYILVALFDAIEKGKASLDEMLTYKPEFTIDGSGVLNSLQVGTTISVKNVATLMIIVSDNIATNMLIDYLGVKEINEVIQAMGWKDTILHNPIDFEKYDKLGTTTPKDYADAFIKMAKGTLISKEASWQMIDILKQQHLNSMLTKEIAPYYLDPDNYDEQLIAIASKSGSMNACRNDGGIIMTPFGNYVIVLLNKNFSDMMYYNAHPAIHFGARVSQLVFNQYMALQGRIEKPHNYYCRLAGKNDIKIIADIMEKVYEGLEDKTIFICDDEDYVRKVIETDIGFAAVACEEDTDEVVATFLAHYPDSGIKNMGHDIGLSEDKLGQVAHMDSCTVLKEHRGNNLEKRLLKFAEAMVDHEKYHYLCATASPDNPASCSSLESLGYVHKLTKEKYTGVMRNVYVKEI